MFFIFLSVLTYKDRKQNRMMQVLFFTFLCLAVGFLKDSIFLSRAMYGNPFIDNMVGIFDVSVMLVVCNFFLEAVRPESTKKPSVWIYPAAELLLIPIYAIFRDNGIVTAAYILGYAAAVGKVIYIMIYAIRHRKYMHNHYSYSDNISLRWVVISCLIYFVSVFIYAMAFSVSTWQSEVLYCVLTITVCSYIIYSALRLLLIEMVLFHLFINFIYRFSPVQHIVFIGRIVVVITMVQKTVPAITEDFFYNFLFLH